MKAFIYNSEFTEFLAREFDLDLASVIQLEIEISVELSHGIAVINTHTNDDGKSMRRACKPELSKTLSTMFGIRQDQCTCIKIFFSNDSACYCEATMFGDADIITDAIKDYNNAANA